MSPSCIQAPFPLHAFQLALVPALELDPRAGDEIPDGGSDEYLARGGRPGHPSTNRDGNPRDLALVELALARVCTPARSSSPIPRTLSTTACAQRIARAGPSKVAKKPSPAVSFSSPRNRASSRRTSA